MTTDGYKAVVVTVGSCKRNTVDEKNNEEETLTDYQIYCVRQRAMYIIAALKFARDNIPKWT